MLVIDTYFLTLSQNKKFRNFVDGQVFVFHENFLLKYSLG